MTKYFDELTEKQDLLRIRLLFASAFFCSFIFHYFMIRLSPNGRDSEWGRALTAVVALAGFIVTFLVEDKKKYAFVFANLLTQAYLFVYLYLMHINNWSLFHRWSYFVVGAVLCSCALRWKDYILTAVVAILAPLFLGFLGPLTFLELIHFHITNLTVFFVIGLSVRSHFHYKEEVKTLTQSLVQNSKMAALGEMAGGMAHEINNPLMTIISLTTLTKLQIDKGTDKNQLITLMNRVEENSFRIGKIITSLRNFSRTASDEEFLICDLRGIVNTTLEFCTEKFKRAEVILDVSLPRFAINSYCQPVAVSQVILNLLNNAYDACAHLPNPKITLSLTVGQGSALIRICDSGPGVPPEIEDKIMDPFFTTKPTGDGRGLGLSICLGIAKANKGDLYLDRKVSDSCFVFKLPSTD